MGSDIYVVQTVCNLNAQVIGFSFRNSGIHLEMTKLPFQNIKKKQHGHFRKNRKNFYNLKY